MKNIILNSRQIALSIYQKLASKTLLLIFIYFSLLMIFLTYNIGRLSSAEPTALQVDEKISSSSKIKMDKEALNKLNELIDRDISLEALFDNGRTNPFEN